MTSMDEHVFPQRAGNEFHLLADGDRFYPAMLQAVEQAQHYILMEMYLVESGRVADLFCAAFIAVWIMTLSISLRHFQLNVCLR